jgi:hypothetical protein
MRFKSRRLQSHDTVLLAGWLFADLFLALAIIFLSANTAGIKLQPVPTAIPTPAATPSPIVNPTPVPLPRLELDKHRITLTDIDTSGLLNGSQDAINNLKQQMRSQIFLNDRTVGLVIVYGGAPDDSQILIAQDIANKVMDVLSSLGREGFAFTRTSYYDPLYILPGSANTVVIDVYLFA